eukprot:5467462-Prymnesium_polylepis.1
MNPLTSLYVQQMWMANTTSGDGVIDGVICSIAGVTGPCPSVLNEAADELPAAFFALQTKIYVVAQ